MAWNQSGWPNKSVRLSVWEIGEFEGRGFESGPHIFESWLSQTNDLKIDTCRALAWHSALLRYGKVWFAQCQDNMTEWYSRSWCWQPGVPVKQHYKVTMSAHCHMLVLVPLLGLSDNCEALLHTSLDH